MSFVLPLPKPMSLRDQRRYFAKLEKNPEHRKKMRLAADILAHRKEKMHAVINHNKAVAHKAGLLRGSKSALKKHGGTSKLVDHPKECLNV